MKCGVCRAPLTVRGHVVRHGRRCPVYHPCPRLNDPAAHPARFRDSAAPAQLDVLPTDRLGKLMNERRWCYWIPTDGAIGGKGYRVSIVIENESGHYPTGDTPEGGMREPWFWGDELEDARAFAEKQNAEKLGIDAKTAALIVASSMGASR